MWEDFIKNSLIKGEVFSTFLWFLILSGQEIYEKKDIH